MFDGFPATKSIELYYELQHGAFLSQESAQHIPDALASEPQQYQSQRYHLRQHKQSFTAVTLSTRFTSHLLRAFGVEGRELYHYTMIFRKLGMAFSHGDVNMVGWLQESCI